MREKAKFKSDSMKKIETTADVRVPERLIDQIIGQAYAVDIVKKAARQKRNVLLLGNPGTGKSMLAQAMAQLMPAENLEDVLIYPNQNDENKPRVKVVKTYPSELEIRKNPEMQALYKRALPKNQNPALAAIEPVFSPETGQGRRIIDYNKNRITLQTRGIAPTTLIFLVFLGFLIIFLATDGFKGQDKWFLLAIVLGALGFWLFYRLTTQLGKRMAGFEASADPKLIIDNSGNRNAPFVDASGAKAGALFGDVKHDPLQSGGLGTPPHLRVESGSIHRANKGVLFIDEIASLRPKSQMDLLTAMQEKKFSITGQSEMSSGALVKTEPVPCDFVLVAAGNVIDLGRMHPALRSRIRGNGYEVFVQDSMEDTEENENRLVQFIAQEVKKDAKIPHFDMGAVEQVINEARRRAGRKKKLTLNLRELGGLVRAAGDVAREEGAKLVTKEHVAKAKVLAHTLEQQLSDRVLEVKKDYKVFASVGGAVGRVNGLAVMGDGSSGLVMPIVAEVTPASSRSEGKLIATGKLGAIAKEAVENVSAIIKKHIGRDVSQYDMHVQFLQTYDGVEGDSASVAIAVAVLSAMEGIEVNQALAMTGSLSVRGEVLPVGGVTAKVEAAIDSGITEVVVPKSNFDDIYLAPEVRKKIKITPASTLVEVLSRVLLDSPAKRTLIGKMKNVGKKK